MEIVPCVLVVLCACYGEMCDWLNLEIYVVDMCYWDCALCSCWWGDVLLELRNELERLNCLHALKQIVKYDCDEIELRWWSNDVMMKCENMNIGERSIVLFIFAYQIWMKLKWGQPQKGEDSRIRKRYEAGTPASEKENGRGLPQLKRDYEAGDPQEKEMYMAGTPANEWWYGGDSHKKRAGTPAIYGVANLISKHEEERIGLSKSIIHINR